MTQAQVAESVGVSHVAVSKWENGKSLPDASLMLAVCETLGITANELLSGERVETEEYREKAEETIVELQKSSEKKGKWLKRILWGLLAAAAAFILAFVIHNRYNADVQIGKGRPIGAAEDRYMEVIMYTFAGCDFVGIAPSLELHLLQLHLWNDGTVRKIYAYPMDKPHHIEVSGEVHKGQTTLRYEGYVTDENGGRVDIKEEMTFDFVLDRKPFENRRLGWHRRLQTN